MKPCYSHLRLLGHTVSGYIDDTFAQGSDFDSAVHTSEACKELFTKLGFIIHPDKSMNVPSQCTKVLRFLIDSVNMTVSQTPEKKQKISLLCEETLKLDQMTIRHLAEVIGKLVSTFPAVQFGPLHYRTLEVAKTKALQKSKGNFDVLTMTSEATKLELT